MRSAINLSTSMTLNFIPMILQHYSTHRVLIKLFRRSVVSMTQTDDQLNYTLNVIILRLQLAKLLTNVSVCSSAPWPAPVCLSVRSSVCVSRPPAFTAQSHTPGQISLIINPHFILPSPISGMSARFLHQACRQTAFRRGPSGCEAVSGRAEGAWCISGCPTQGLARD